MLIPDNKSSSPVGSAESPGIGTNLPSGDVPDQGSCGSASTLGDSATSKANDLSAPMQNAATADAGGGATLFASSLLTEDIEDAPFWKEVVAYAKFTSMEIQPYQGKFIAVYQGNIVDSDFDEAELALRFYRVFGYVPVYIHAVGLEDDVIDVLD